jgi:hypothetical protein
MTKKSCHPSSFIEIMYGCSLKRKIFKLVVLLGCCIYNQPPLSEMIYGTFKTTIFAVKRTLAQWEIIKLFTKKLELN